MKKSYIEKMDHWRGVLEMLADQVKEKETELLSTKQRLDLVLQQKRGLDKMLIEQI